MAVETYLLPGDAPGRWRIKARIRTAPGEPVITRWRRVSGTKVAAQRAAAAWREELRHEAPAGSPRTVADLAKLYLETIAPVSLGLGGFADAKGTLDRHVLPVIGTVPLARIGPEHVDLCLLRAKEKGLAYRSLVKVRAKLSRLFSVALRRRWVAGNPVRLTDPPKDDRPAVNRRLPLDTVGRLLEAVAGTWLELPVSIAVLCGLRRGEICGLRVGDLDLGDRRIHVRRRVAEVGGKLEVGPPKARSFRTVSFPPEMVPAFAAHLRDLDRTLVALRGEGMAEDDPLFLGATGELLRPQALNRGVAPVCAAIGLPPGVRLHALRHTHASEMLSGGADLADVARRLGHSRVSTTADFYLGQSADALDRAEEGASDLLHRARAAAKPAARGARGANSWCHPSADTTKEEV